MVGFVKIHRQIKDNILFKEKRVFSKFEAWVDILLSCNFTPGEFLLGYETCKIESGSHITSKLKLMKKYSWGKVKLNNFLELLEKQNMISQKTVGKGNHKATQLSVLNWGKYQVDQPNYQPSNGTKDYPKTTLSGPQYKKEKKDNKEKNIISKDITTEVETFGNKEINDILGLLQKAVGIDEFKESQKWQRIYGKHFCNYINKNGKENFIERLKGVLSDDFKSSNCNSIKYLYNEVKAYIHSPIVEKEKKNKGISI